MSETKGVPLRLLLWSSAPKDSPEYQRAFEEFRALYLSSARGLRTDSEPASLKEQLQDDVIQSLRREVASLEDQLRLGSDAESAPKDED